MWILSIRKFKCRYKALSGIGYTSLYKVVSAKPTAELEPITELRLYTSR